MVMRGGDGDGGGGGGGGDVRACMRARRGRACTRARVGIRRCKAMKGKDVLFGLFCFAPSLALCLRSLFLSLSLSLPSLCLSFSIFLFFSVSFVRSLFLSFSLSLFLSSFRVALALLGGYGATSRRTNTLRRASIGLG